MLQNQDGNWDFNIMGMVDGRLKLPGLSLVLEWTCNVTLIIDFLMVIIMRRLGVGLIIDVSWENIIPTPKLNVNKYNNNIHCCIKQALHFKVSMVWTRFACLSFFPSHQGVPVPKILSWNLEEVRLFFWLEFGTTLFIVWTLSKLQLKYVINCVLTKVSSLRTVE